MEIKYDLAALIKMLIGSQNDTLENAIKTTEETLDSARNGLETSYKKT